MRIILASASPRRKEILSRLTDEFEIIPSDCEEIVPKNTGASKTVEILSEQKAVDVSSKTDKDAVIIGCDTVVSLNDEIFGKPQNDEDAVRILSLLSGKSHKVYTGVTIIRNSDGKKITFSEETEVFFAEMSEEEIYSYVKTGEPLDKAGAYGIQDKGGVYIRRISGDYNNVVGLPLQRVYECLKSEFNF